ncbi:kinase-like domain-containing protein [Rhizophagus clarus]|uniref:Kinase-like domain-containing protein n=1 Tax=Rhizophagus clarus TaxID=94130 RepID=A0A8H3QT96_9GLOM|nr:kinase-like domain-containing protein [Rhizophagus clarus]
MEIEPKTQNIRDVFEEELGIIVDGLVNLYGKDPNKGLEDDVKKQHIFDYITDSAELENIVAQLELADIHIHGKVLGKFH